MRVLPGARTLPGMSSAPTVEKDCPGSRGPALDPSADKGTGTCPVCGRTLRLGYALLLPAHTAPPVRGRGV